MTGRNVVRLAMAAALSLALGGVALPGAALAQYPNSGGKYWNPEAQHNQQFHRDDFEGRWVVQDRYDADNRGGGWGNGGWGNSGWGNGGWGRNGGFGMASLPNFLNIDQGRRAVRIADRQNNLVQVIAIEDGVRGFRSQATFLRGQIRGSRLVATGTDARGRQMTQTLMLRNRGETLVVRTQVESRFGRTMTFEKVYERA